MTRTESQQALHELDELRQLLASLRDDGPRERIGEIGNDIRRLAAYLRRIGAQLETQLTGPAAGR
jgi:hypothetical protein